MSLSLTVARIGISTALLIASFMSGAAIAAPDDAMDQGLYMARAANCSACHTALGGEAYAGGRKMVTPLGNIYTTNITPDAETGIGTYSLDDFDRAVRHGIAKDGHRLYPAMPYPSYAKLSDADLKSLYGYFMKSVTPVSLKNLPTEIPWPLNIRFPLAAWDFVFSPALGYKDKPGLDEAWNRGAYLVQGPGHCGACHTPRGLAMQERALDESGGLFFTGANLDSWSSPNLHSNDRAGLGRWADTDIVEYLKTGRNRFGSAFGSMIEVINSSTQYLTDSDLHAIAKYLKSLPPTDDGAPTPYVYDGSIVATLEAGTSISPGGLTYVQNCSACHTIPGQGQGLFIAALAGNPSVMDRDPTSLINIVLNGSMPLVISGQPDGYRMPSFRATLNDQQVAGVVSFVRQSWGNKAPEVTADSVTKIRKSTNFVRYADQLLHMQ